VAINGVFYVCNIIVANICNTYLPIAKTVASDSGIDVSEAVITHSSPDTVMIDFQASLGRRWTVHQPHYRLWFYIWLYTQTRYFYC